MQSPWLCGAVPLHLYCCQCRIATDVSYPTHSSHSPFRVPQRPLTGPFTLSSAYIIRRKVILVFKEQKFRVRGAASLRCGLGVVLLPDTHLVNRCFVEFGLLVNCFEHCIAEFNRSGMPRSEDSGEVRSTFRNLFHAVCSCRNALALTSLGVFAYRLAGSIAVYIR